MEFDRFFSLLIQQLLFDTTKTFKVLLSIFC